MSFVTMPAWDTVRTPAADIEVAAAVMEVASGIPKTSSMKVLRARHRNWSSPCSGESVFAGVDLSIVPGNAIVPNHPLSTTNDLLSLLVDPVPFIRITRSHQCPGG